MSKVLHNNDSAKEVLKPHLSALIGCYSLLLDKVDDSEELFGALKTIMDAFNDDLGVVAIQLVGWLCDKCKRTLAKVDEVLLNKNTSDIVVH